MSEKGYKELLLEIFIIRFLNQCEAKGWGNAALTYVYNSNNAIEDQKSPEDFENLLYSGDITLKDFVPVLHAVMGPGEFVSR